MKCFSNSISINTQLVRTYESTRSRTKKLHVLHATTILYATQAHVSVRNTIEGIE
jgi:hypothetical protein